MQNIKIDSIALDFLKTAENTNLNIFLTWNAGTGKSTILKFFQSKTKKKFITLWTTGTAAINVNWYTIHSFLWIMKNGNIKGMKAEKKEYIKKSNGFIIDEAPMMRSDLFDKIDYVLRKITWKEELFWWKQIIFVWDMFQLPPVLVQYELDDEWRKVDSEEYTKFVERYNGRFFFNANTYDKNKFKVINLTTVHRQKKMEFVNALNKIRVWIINYDILNMINSRITKTENICEKSIYICSANKTVDKINREKLWKIRGEYIDFNAIIQWEYPDNDDWLDKWIRVKIWCRVMITANHKDGIYSNWTLWTLTKVDKNFLVIEDDNGYEIQLEKITLKNVIWEDEVGNEVIAWTFTQYPLKLWHAITIHKSQGKTFDNVIIDTWYGCFECGMLYVALSRCTSLEWIQLVKKIKVSDVKADETVKKYLLTK